jgi:hypothetical protein
MHGFGMTASVPKAAAKATLFHCAYGNLNAG